ncbi:MAG TPA: hypothetical protein VM243_03315 [Phycisphaerae bacterium]|nr:hypothetical protein [Phycisphaerae bacterium]
MRAVLTEEPAVAAPISRTDRLRRFMSVYWLRPENAFWMALRSETLASVAWQGPGIDLGCGDGVFSFLHAGGVFDDDFDVFHDAAPLEAVRDEQVDIFDHLGARYHPAIVKRPGFTIDVGCDWKPNLLVKAGYLSLYEELVVHDNNRPLPFDAGGFRTVYCNTAYWVEDIDGFLSELRRITADDGRVVLQVKLASMLRYTLERHREVLGDRFLEIIGRGRAETWPTVTDRATWEARFTAAGLTIERAVPFITRTHAHLWDVGLRPIAPMLIELANNVTPATRGRVKRRWVDLFCELCAPFCDPEVDLLAGQDEPGEIMYVLRPG